MSDDYARHAGRTGDANFTPSTLAEERAHAEGVADRYGRAAANTRSGGGAGLLMLPLLAAWAACLWPLVAALTFFPGYVAWRALDRVADDAHPLLPLLAPAIAGGIGLFAGIKTENVLQRFALYRGVRHIVRLLATAILAIWILLHYPGTPPLPENWTVGWIHQNLSGFQLLLIALAMLATHVLSMRMDRELRDPQGDEDVDYDIGDEDRGDRWRRRARSFVFFGIVGGILVPVLGYESDNMLPAFVFAGAGGVVLSRWLYPAAVHPGWRLLPWVYFGKRSRRERQRRRDRQMSGSKPSVP